MLNLFSYGNSDSEDDEKENELSKTAKQPAQILKREKDDETFGSISKDSSLFGVVPKPKKQKISKHQRLQTIAKFANVSVKELEKEFYSSSKESEQDKNVNKKGSQTLSLLNLLPTPQNEVKSEINHRTEEAINQNDIKIEINDEKNDSDSDDYEIENPLISGHKGVIPLNPFLSDAESIKAPGFQSSLETDAVSSHSVDHFEPVMENTLLSTKNSSQDIQQSSATPSFGYDTMSTSTARGYGGNFSQDQYEAYMRKSGMLSSIHAETTSSANLLGEDSKLYDKQTIRAIEEGNYVNLNQNDLHDHDGQPDDAYWEKKRKKAAVAEEFGKYAHIAPTQVQQARHQISFLAAQAINELADIDSRRAQTKKTKNEVRAKYGW